MAYITFQPKDNFNVKLYTGTGATQSITGVGFQPDFLWIKSRGLARSNQINDAVRGAGKILATDNNSAEFLDTDRITSLDSDGFTLGSNDNVNGSSDNLVSYSWLANNTSGSSNTDGSITSTVSANTTSGFSIVTYTGTGSAATVGHGLGVAPSFYVCKNLSVLGNWISYWKVHGATKYQVLNDTDTVATSAAAWNDTEPTSSVFTVNTGSTVNGSGNNLIAYCFTEKKGFSKFGSYTGNGNADGTFIYTGFKPSWLVIKRTDSIDSWFMYDNKRSSFNVIDDYLLVNSSGVEATTSAVNLDFLSNGFKLRNTDGGHNASGGSYIYMAFADQPLVTSNGLPSNAR